MQLMKRRKQTHHQLFDSSSLQKLKTAALCALCVRMNWRSPPPSRAREKSSIVRLPFAHVNSALRSADNAYVQYMPGTNSLHDGDKAKHYYTHVVC